MAKKKIVKPVVLPDVKPEPLPVVAVEAPPIDVEFVLGELYYRFGVLRSSGQVDELIAVIGEILKLGGTIPQTETGGDG